MSINVNVPNRLEPNEKTTLDQARESIQILNTLYRQYLIELNNIHNGMYNRKTLLSQYNSIIRKIYKCIASTTTMDKLEELQSTRTNLLFGVPFNLKLNNHDNPFRLKRTHTNTVKRSNNMNLNNNMIVNTTGQQQHKTSAASSSVNVIPNHAAQAISNAYMMSQASQPVRSSKNNGGIIKTMTKKYNKNGK